MTDGINWNDFLDSEILYDSRQVLTDIECPKCGRRIYLDDTVVLTTYPPQYRYWCSCGWDGTSFVRWRK